MRILIVEDEFNAREGLAALIKKTSPKHEICGKAADGEEGTDRPAQFKRRTERNGDDPGFPAHHRVLLTSGDAG